jgi:hypothetical protein
MLWIAVFLTNSPHRRHLLLLASWWYFPCKGTPKGFTRPRSQRVAPWDPISSSGTSNSAGSTNFCPAGHMGELGAAPTAFTENRFRASRFQAAQQARFASIVESPNEVATTLLPAPVATSCAFLRAEPRRSQVPGVRERPRPPCRLSCRSPARAIRRSRTG